MPLSIPNTSLPDNFTDAATFSGNDVFTGGFITIANNPAEVQLRQGIHGQAVYGPSIYLPPGTYPIVSGRSIPIAGIRARNAIAGSVAQFFGAIFFPGEPQIQGGTFLDATVSASGAVTPAGGGGLTLVSRTTIAADVLFTNAGAVLISAPAFTADGATTYEVEIFTPGLLTRSDSQFSDLYLRDGGVQLGRLARAQTSVSAVDSEAPVLAKVRLVPAAGAHTYDLFGIRGAAAAATFRAGAGGVGTNFQAYMMISTV